MTAMTRHAADAVRYASMSTTDPGHAAIAHAILALAFTARDTTDQIKEA